MANYSTLKAAVADVVKTNGTQAITGANLQAVLLSIINSVGGGGYIFKGVATPSTSAGTPDENVFYVGGAGTYANFGTSVTVPVGSIGVFKYNGSWTKEQIALFAGIDDVPTAGSDYLVKSGGVYSYFNEEVKDIDLGETVTGQYIYTPTGGFSSADGLERTGFIKIAGLTKVLVGVGVKTNNVAIIAFYSSNSTTSFISSVNSSDYTIGTSVAVDVPSNANYCAICWRIAYENSAYLKINSPADEIMSLAEQAQKIAPIETKIASIDEEIIKINGRTGFTLSETRSGLNYQDCHIPQGGNYKVELIDGANVVIYTKQTSSGSYTTQGTLINVGDTLTLNTTNDINFIALYPGSSQDNTVLIYEASGLVNDIETLNTNLNSFEADVNAYNFSIPYTLTESGYINYGNGLVVAADNYKHTDYINCINFSNIILKVSYSDNAGIAFYDKDKVYISGIGKSDTEDFGDIVTKNVPSDAYFMRISVRNSEASTFYLKSIDYPTSIYVAKDNASEMCYSLGTLQEGYIIYLTGAFVSASTYRVTDYIKLVGKKITYRIYFTDAAGLAFYDKDKVYISGINNASGSSAYGTYEEVSIPDGAVYIRYCSLTSYAGRMSLQCTDGGTLVDLLSTFNSDENTPSEVNPCFYKESSGCRTFKKILCIGDSLTSGTFEYRDGGDTLHYFEDATLSYPTFLKCLTGRDTTNKGSGGQTTKSWWELHQNDDLSSHDACIIALGRNDYVAGRETTTAERYEYMGYIINKVRTENPQIKVFVATLLNYYTGTDAEEVNEDMRGIATANNCYLVDIAQYGRLVFADDAYSHLTAEGYEQVANYYFNYISYIMAQNPADFKNIQFIGTEHYY